MYKHIVIVGYLTLLLAGCATTQQQNEVSVTQTVRGVEIRSSERIMFDSGKYEVKASGKPFLDQMATILNTKTRNTVLIEGHTDNVGSKEFNRDLSELRALTVMKELVNRGVSKARIRYAGYGMSRPLADNGTEYGRSQNRRTDIVILGEKKENIGADPFNTLMQSVVNFGKGLLQ